MLTRQDARTARALASLAKFAPESMAAGHLFEKAEKLADRIESEAGGWSRSEGTVTEHTHPEHR